jgi:hypothetical protein
VPGTLAKIGGQADVVDLECPLQGGLELAIGIGDVELGSRDSDPGAAARRPRANVWRDLAVRRERQADQLLLGGFAAGENARPLRDVRLLVRR